jgi:hypothetical protein
MSALLKYSCVQTEYSFFDMNGTLIEIDFANLLSKTFVNSGLLVAFRSLAEGFSII